MLAGKPFARAAKAGVNLVEDQQRAVLVAELAEQRQKFRRRNVDAAAGLNRLDENRADLLAAEERADALLDFVAADVRRLMLSRFDWRLLTSAATGNGTKCPNSPQLRAERPAKMIAMRGVERAVAEAVIRALERDDAGLARGQHRGLERRLDRLKAGVAEDGLARADFGLWLRTLTSAQRSKVIRLSSRASCALSACGCTSPIACSSLAICCWPARTTRGFAWPAAATPNAAVRSRYFFPSASQT